MAALYSVGTIVPLYNHVTGGKGGAWRVVCLYTGSSDVYRKPGFVCMSFLIPKLCKTVFHLVQKLNFVLSRAFTRSVDYNCFLPAYNLVQ